MEERVRIAIIHHNCLFREGLAFHLSQQQDLSVVIVAAEGHILGETAGLSLDVIIMALVLPGQDSPTVTRQLHEFFPDAKILIDHHRHRRNSRATRDSDATDPGPYLWLHGDHSTGVARLLYFCRYHWNLRCAPRW